MNAAIFRQLADAAEAQGVVLQNAAAPRWLSTSDEADSDFMAKADVLEMVTLSRHRKALIALHQGARMLVFVGFEQVEQPLEGLTPIRVSSGIFSLAVTTLEVKSIASGADIREVLELDFLDPNDKDESGHSRYAGHDVNDVLKLFPRIDAFLMDEGYIFTENISRCVGLYMCKSTIQWTLAIDECLVKIMTDLFEAGRDNIPYNNVLQGMISFTWSAYYLDIYRCIERLFLIPRVKRLAADLRSTASLLDYCRFLETHLSWRPKEEEALRMLLAQCEADRLESILKAFKVPFPPIENSEQKSKATEKATSAIYKLRNDIVHFRPANEIVSFPPEEWNNIIGAVTSTMQELYEIYHADLEGPLAISTT